MCISSAGSLLAIPNYSIIEYKKLDFDIVRGFYHPPPLPMVRGKSVY